MKRSFTIRGHRTSISLEPVFWDALSDIAIRQERSVSAVVAEIDAARVLVKPGPPNLSSAIRVVLFRQAKDPGVAITAALSAASSGDG